MDNSIRELGKIRDSIISGKVSESQLRDAMDKVKKEYGDDVFKSFDLNSIRQYTYNKPYYERLIQLAKNGACSQEFYLHLLRVRDSVKKQSVKKTLLNVSIILLLLISIFNLGISLKNNLILRNQAKEAVVNIEDCESMNQTSVNTNEVFEELPFQEDTEDIATESEKENETETPEVK